jgi:hypothetical protein
MIAVGVTCSTSLFGYPLQYWKMKQMLPELLGSLNCCFVPEVTVNFKVYSLNLEPLLRFWSLFIIQPLKVQMFNTMFWKLGLCLFLSRKVKVVPTLGFIDQLRPEIGSS